MKEFWSSLICLDGWDFPTVGTDLCGAWHSVLKLSFFPNKERGKETCKENIFGQYLQMVQGHAYAKTLLFVGSTEGFWMLLWLKWRSHLQATWCWLTGFLFVFVKSYKAAAQKWIPETCLPFTLWNWIWKEVRGAFIFWALQGSVTFSPSFTSLLLCNFGSDFSGCNNIRNLTSLGVAFSLIEISRASLFSGICSWTVTFLSC